MVVSSLTTMLRAAYPTATVGPAREDSVETALWFGDRKARRDAVSREYEAAAVAGLTDRSWVAKIRLSGPDRLTFLQGMITQDVAKLPPGQTRHAAMLDPTGHFVAELFIHTREEDVLIETDPRCAPKFAEILDKYLITEEVAIEDVTRQWAVMSLHGADSAEALAQSGAASGEAAAAGAVHVPLAWQGRAGFAAPARHGSAGGYDLWLPADSAAGLWTALAEHAAPVGSVAAEILRVEAGIPRWGTELDPSILLPEAGMEDAVSYGKGCYIGQEIVARIHARGHTNRSLRAILFDDGAPVDAGNKIYPVQDGAEREIGRVTSAVDSPLAAGRLALAYIRREFLTDGTEIFAIASNGAPCPGVIREYPIVLQ